MMLPEPVSTIAVSVVGPSGLMAGLGLSVALPDRPVVAVAAALGIAMLALDISYASFMSNFFDQVKLVDFVTGVSKGAVFGILIAIIACYNGLKVTGGAAGVFRYQHGGQVAGAHILVDGAGDILGNALFQFEVFVWHGGVP